MFKLFNSLLLFCLTSICVLFGQNDTDKEKIFSILESSQKKYESISVFQTKVIYSLFPTYQSKQAREVFQGFIVKRKDEFYSKINNTELVTLKNLSLKIDNESKLLQIDFSKSSPPDLPFDNLKQIFQNFKSFKFETNNIHHVCTMFSPKISFVPYYKVVVYINKNDFTFHKQELYFIEKVNYKAKDGTIKKDYPKLIITFEKLNTSISEFLQYFDSEYYISKKGNKVIPTQNYPQYTIVD